MSVVPRSKGSGQPPEERPVPERRIQGLANAAFLRVHDAAAKVIDVPAQRDATRQEEDAPPLELVTPAAEPATVEAAKARSRVAERLARIADKTASRTREATSSAFAASRTGFARAARVSRESVLPELRERTRPERLAADYRAFLIWLHANVLDSAIERLFFVPTAGHAALDGLTIRGANRAQGHDYRPTPYFVFKWAMSAVEDDPSRLSFVDYGAGKGRALLLAAHYPFAAVGGIEFAEELHDNATMNIAQFSRSKMKCRNVECTLADVADVKPLEGEAIHYFFNPFAPEMFAEVLNGIVASYHAKPRRLYLILIDMDAAEIVHRTGVFQEAQLQPAERLMARFLSPYKISVYRSLA
jgi:hypothetical protein